MIDDTTIRRANSELSTKTLCQIQTETAYTWAARAIVAYQFFEETHEPHWLSDATEYAHEATEHAALAGPTVYEQVHGEMVVVRQRCGVEAW